MTVWYGRGWVFIIVINKELYRSPHPPTQCSADDPHPPFPCDSCHHHSPLSSYKRETNVSKEQSRDTFRSPSTVLPSSVFNICTSPLTYHSIVKQTSIGTRIVWIDIWSFKFGLFPPQLHPPPHSFVFFGSIFWKEVWWTCHLEEWLSWLDKAKMVRNLCLHICQMVWLG